MSHRTRSMDIIREDKRRKLERPVTGIIWKDRIWEQWYSKTALEQKLPQMNQKEYLFSCIEEDSERVIINNRGKRTYTVQQFRILVEKYEKAFKACKLNVGDVICTISLSTPEMYVIKYASTSLGLITCNLNVFDVGINDEGLNRLYRQMKNVNPKVIFVLDIFEDKISEIVNSVEFKDILKIRLPLSYALLQNSMCLSL